MLIKDFNKAVEANRLSDAREIGLAILSSPIPYPKSLQQCVEAFLQEHFPGVNVAVATEDINDEDAALVTLVEENGWIFDHSYYSTQAETAFLSRRDAIFDYLKRGWRKGYDPCRFFSTRFYLGYQDIAASGICPLVHYLEHGMNERRSTADPFKTMYRAADLVSTDHADKTTTTDPSIGVFIHLFYPELSDLIISYLNNIPYRYSLHISTRPESTSRVKELFESKCRLCNRVYVDSFPNIGRDVAPFLCGFGSEVEKYKVILKLHSKRSPHEKLLSNWLEHILDNLLGSPDIIKTLISQLTSEDTKLIYPIETLEIMYGISKDSCWGHNDQNYKYAQPILEKWNVKSERNEKFVFPAGTMFWCQAEILKPLVDLGLSFSDFDEEGGQIDGTLAHAIERLIGISATSLFNGKIKTSFLAWNQGKKGKHRLYKQIAKYPINISGFEKVYHYPSSNLTPLLIRPGIRSDSLDIHWVIPNFQLGAGGHMTIFRAISYLERSGHTCTIWIHSLRESDQDSVPSVYHRTKICNHFLGIEARVYLLGGSPECLDQISGDIVIATDRMSVYPVLGMKNFLARAYFIQDHEPSFFAVGSESILSELTYDSANGFLCLCASAWLAKLMTEKYGNNAAYFPLAVDQATYKPCDPKKKKFGQIAFYVRRSTPRRLFAIGLLALHELFASGARFSVVVFGEDYTPDLNLPVDTKYLGVLSSSELRDVYAQSYIGLVLSGTNYSLIPNEMMAVGLPVVDIDGEHTRLSYKEETVILSHPSPKCIAEKLRELLDDQKLWQKHFSAGIEATSSLTWDKSFSTVRTAIVDACLKSYDNYPLKLSGQNEKPLVTVVIPAYNGGALLKECIQAVLLQNTTFSFDLIVIDSSSSDGSIETIKDMPRVAIHRIPKEEFGHGKTRNLGAQLAQGAYVAYLTQDAVPANRFWLQNLVSPMIEDPDIAGVFGAHIAHPNHSPLADMDLYNHFYLWLSDNHSTPIRLNEPFTSTALQDHERFYSDNNSCLRRTVWEAIPYPDVIYGEDQMWAEYILKAGHKKAFAPMSIVYHSHEYGFREALSRANTEWHYFNECLGKKLPHEKQDVYAMVEHSIQSDMAMSQSLGLSVDRKVHHFARAAGYYLAGKGHGCLKP